MSIHKIGSDLIRPFTPKGTRATEQKKDGDASPRPGRSERADRVGFSAEGLALAAQAQGTEKELSPERLADIESKVADGFYHTPEVADEVARRVLASGDL